jgi:RNA polymerase sigma-70 factor (ECF subfamily)
MTSTDEELVKEAQKGDLAAYSELVSRHQHRVYNLAARMLGNPEDAGDAAQEILIKAFRSLTGYNYRASFTTWLYRVAVTVCLDLLHQRTRRREDLTDTGPPESRQTPVHLLRDTRPGPEETYLEKERALAVRKAVAALPTDYRIALVLQHYQGLSYKEVSAILNLPEKTVATRLHRARLMLKERLLGGDVDAMSGY